MIYLDNAATTMRKPQEVIDAITAVMCSMGNAGRGVNEASLGAARTVYDTREKLAGFFGAEDARQIVFTMNSTESLNIAIKGILNPGDHVISTVLEHNSVLRPLYEMEKKGVEVTFLGCDEKGTLDYADFDKAIKENTKAKISATHGMPFIIYIGQLLGRKTENADTKHAIHAKWLFFSAELKHTRAAY